MLAVVRACGDPRPPSLTALWGLPCTVSDDTRLFPPGLDFNLGVDALANTDGIQSCFLRKEVPLSLEAAAHFAKQLY